MHEYFSSKSQADFLEVCNVLRWHLLQHDFVLRLFVVGEKEISSVVCSEHQNDVNTGNAAWEIQ